MLLLLLWGGLKHQDNLPTDCQTLRKSKAEASGELSFRRCQEYNTHGNRLRKAYKVCATKFEHPLSHGIILTDLRTRVFGIYVYSCVDILQEFDRF